jgi:hypothetical protein
METSDHAEYFGYALCKDTSESRLPLLHRQYPEYLLTLLLSNLQCLSATLTSRLMLITCLVCPANEVSNPESCHTRQTERTKYPGKIRQDRMEKRDSPVQNPFSTFPSSSIWFAGLS